MKVKKGKAKFCSECGKKCGKKGECMNTECSACESAREAEEQEALAAEAEEAETEESEAEAEESEESEEGEESEEAEEAEEADESEESSRKKVLVALRGKMDEAHDPETIADLMDAFKAYLDEELSEAGEEEPEEEEPSEEEVIKARATVAEKDGFKKYASEGDEEMNVGRARKAAEKDGYKKYSKEVEAALESESIESEEAEETEEGEESETCSECGAPMKKGKKESDPSTASLAHRLREKEVRFQMSNEEKIRLMKENAELKASLRPYQLREAATKFLKEAKVPEGLINIDDLVTFPQEQWGAVLNITVPPAMREAAASGGGERVLLAANILAGTKKEESSAPSDTAIKAFQESYKPGETYLGSEDAEDPFEDKK